MISPGKTRFIGADYAGSAFYERLVAGTFNLKNAVNPDVFLAETAKWASLEAYNAWKKAYSSNANTFLDHPMWGADRDLGDGHYLYGAMDDRYATNAQRVFGSQGLVVGNDVVDKDVCVIGAWDGTECLLMSALGARTVDAVDEVPEFGRMAEAQYRAWNVRGRVVEASLYDFGITAFVGAGVIPRYDFVYVPGVLYHLTDLPVAMLILWSLLRPGGVLAFESVADNADDSSARYLGPSVPGWNWWSPSRGCYGRIMHDCGFPDGRCVEYSGGRGWWVGHRSEENRALANGKAGFSRPDLLSIIEHNRKG